jgi:hypothetical protein
MMMAWVQSPVSQCGICNGKRGTVAGFLRTLQFLLPILTAPNAPFFLLPTGFCTKKCLQPKHNGLISLYSLTVKILIHHQICIKHLRGGIFNNPILKFTVGILAYTCYYRKILNNNYKFITTLDFYLGANPMSAGLPAIPTDPYSYSERFSSVSPSL